MYDDEIGYDDGDFYDGDDLEAYGHQDSFEHVMGERHADVTEDDVDDDGNCVYCGAPCFYDGGVGCDEWQAGGFNEDPTGEKRYLEMVAHLTGE